MSLQLAAQHLAAKGRGPDDTLVHMSRNEVKSLSDLAMAHGGHLTINPHTGLPEAGFLSAILPAVAGFALIVLGIFVLFGGLVSQLPALGIAGFVISLVGAVLAVSNLAGLVKGVKVPVAAGKKGSKWSARFEQRWDKRNFGQ